MAKISKQIFIPGIKDKYVRQSIQDTNEVLEFAMQTLQKVKQPREDYREFLELVIIFLGGTPPRGISFRGPGAFHLARWMAKAIYCLKMYLFHFDQGRKNWDSGYLHLSCQTLS